MCQNRLGSILDFRDKFCVLKSEAEIGLGSNLDLRVKISRFEMCVRNRIWTILRLWVPRTGLWKMCQNRLRSIFHFSDTFYVLKSEAGIGLGSNLDLRVKRSILKSDPRIHFGIMGP